MSTPYDDLPREEPNHTPTPPGEPSAEDREYTEPFYASLAADIQQQQLDCEYRNVPTDRLTALIASKIAAHVAAAVARETEGLRKLVAACEKERDEAIASATESMQRDEMTIALLRSNLFDEGANFSNLVKDYEELGDTLTVTREERDKAEADLATALARVAELEGHHQRDEEMIVHRTDEVRSLKSALLAAQKDGERLDWLENQTAPGGQPGSYLGTMHLSQCFADSTGRSWFTKEIRAAIDAARLAADAKEGD